MMIVNRRRVCGGKSLLPAGYTQLEYIKNTSTAYIDTGVIGHGSSSITVVAKYDTTPSNNTWPCVIGWKPSYSSIQQRRIGIMSVNGSSWGFRYDNNAANIGNFDNNKHTFIMNKGTFYLDGNVIVSYEESVFDTDDTLTMFVEKQGNIAGNYYLMGRIYLCKIDNVRNFIPCKNPNNVVGMYDTVEGKFYSSPNGKSFVAGPDV